MIYKTETHCHTIDVSKCGKATAEETVEFYLAHGYTTVVLTNHLNGSTYNNPRFGDQSGWTWDQKVDFFVGGYHKLVEAAKGRLHVLLGCEYHSEKSPNDYQLYGFTEEFMRAHPDMREMKIKDFSPIVREAGMLFFQAHPFRDNMCITDPALLDGIETWNGSFSKPQRNDIADIWADKYGLMKISGTDFHAVRPGKCPVGITTEYPITSNEELLAALRAGTYKLLYNRQLEDGITEENFEM